MEPRIAALVLNGALQSEVRTSRKTGAHTGRRGAGTSLEALPDRLARLEKYLTLEPLAPHIAEFLQALEAPQMRVSHGSRTMAGLWNQVS